MSGDLDVIYYMRHDVIASRLETQKEEKMSGNRESTAVTRVGVR